MIEHLWHCTASKRHRRKNFLLRLKTKIAREFKRTHFASARQVRIIFNDSRASLYEPMKIASTWLKNMKRGYRIGKVHAKKRTSWHIEQSIRGQ